MNISTIVEFTISVTTIISTWYIGNKSIWGQRLGLFANLQWWFYVFAFHRWGLIPLQIFLIIIMIRNLIKWEKEAKYEHR